MLSKAVSSTIFKVFGMTKPGIEPRSPRSLVNTCMEDEVTVDHSRANGLCK